MKCVEADVENNDITEMKSSPSVAMSLVCLWCVSDVWRTASDLDISFVHGLCPQAIDVKSLGRFKWTEEFTFPIECDYSPSVEADV